MELLITLISRLPLVRKWEPLSKVIFPKYMHCTLEILTCTLVSQVWQEIEQ